MIIWHTFQKIINIKIKFIEKNIYIFKLSHFWTFGKSIHIPSDSNKPPEKLTMLC